MEAFVEDSTTAIPVFATNKFVLEYSQINEFVRYPWDEIRETLIKDDSTSEE